MLPLCAICGHSVSRLNRTPSDRSAIASESSAPWRPYTPLSPTEAYGACVSPDPYAFSDPSEYRRVVLKIHADNDLDLGGLFAETLPYLAERTPTADLDDRAKVLLLELDENITFLLLVSLKLKAYLLDDASSYRTTMAALLSAVTSALTGIRQLVSTGLVLPAIQLCRPLRDIVNVALLCVIDQDLTQRFIATTTPAVANHFWHEFLARDKDLKAINQAVEQHVGSTAALFPHVEADLNQMLGMMVHPSFGGGALAMELDLLQMFHPEPGAVRAAHRPLSFSIHQVFRLLLGVFQPSVLPGRHADELVPAADQAFVSQLRRSLVELYLFTIVRLSRTPWVNAAEA